MMNPPVELYAPIADLLARAGIDASPEVITPCALSGNNRIYRVETAVGVFAVKQYFRHEGDTRDRLAAEYAFLTYTKSAVPESTPRPYACDPGTGLALYEFVEGHPFRAGEIGAAQVNAAIQFFRALNVAPLRATAQLPVASEASFTIADHLALIDGRIHRLLEMIPQSDVDAEALGFFQRLDERWQQLSENICVDASRAHLNFEATLAPEQRCISPSDFGFHNALVETNGNIRFLDFEYAGWDDPAKTVGDFFAQLAVPVPPEYYDCFVAKIMGVFPESELLMYRANLLRPVYQVKWCCIALNVFVQVHLARRKFANPGLDETVLKQTQLAKAKQIFQSIRYNPWPILI
jgi:hypothetical protein